MAHGQPDYGAQTSKKTVYSLQDMAELAARLKSIVTFDRRGDVVWLDDFANDMNNWTAVVAGAESATRVDTESLYSGYSVKLNGVLGVLSSVGIYRENPLPVDSKIGLEFAFLPDANVQDVRLDLITYDGTTRHNIYITFRMDDQDLRYLDAAGNPQTLASNVLLRQDGLCWHFMKLVVDLEASEYVRLILDNVEYSMAGLGFQATADASAPMLKVVIQNQGAALAAPPVVHVTNVINTQNEP